MSGTLCAQGHRPTRKNAPNRLPEIYDPAFIHADIDLRSLSEGLVNTRSGRLCLYGPPETRKTDYGRWLAAQLGAPLHVKRASDLLSKWLGESEQNVACAFEAAERDGALLLIDEADSFLLDRRSAQVSWEVTLTNEMLIQMESFSGVVVASTNLMDGLDPASLRRFDLKARFGYLRPDQAWELLHRHRIDLGMPSPAPDLHDRLGRLDELTPGDYTMIRRQHRFRPLSSPTDWIDRLEAECTLKRHGANRIGF